VNALRGADDAEPPAPVDGEVVPPVDGEVVPEPTEPPVDDVPVGGEIMPAPSSDEPIMVDLSGLRI
jgi:hypothetical protein